VVARGRRGKDDRKHNTLAPLYVTNAGTTVYRTYAIAIDHEVSKVISSRKSTSFFIKRYIFFNRNLFLNGQFALGTVIRVITGKAGLKKGALQCTEVSWQWSN
jgi:hypothetical protein